MDNKHIYRLFLIVVISLVSFLSYKMGSKNRGKRCDWLINKNYSFGHEDGKKKGHDEGHDEGYEDGKREGYDKGYEDGKREGYREGQWDCEDCD